MVKEKHLGGIQWFGNNDWNFQFVKKYSINRIARYMLIDPNDIIVSNYAPRLSSPQRINLFNNVKL